MKKIKIIIINILVLVFLLLLIESICYISRLALGKDPKNFLYEHNDRVSEVLKQDCQRMRTDLFLGHVHDHNDSCHIKEGDASGPFVYYKKSSEKDVILVLGGSTTDGFYQNISMGNVWPLYISKLVEKKGLSVINGGVGGYGSSQELLKLLIDGGRINASIKYVVSLNGINDTPGYRATSPGYSMMSEEEANLLPFWTWVQYQMFSDEVFLKQNISTSLLPNVMSFVNYISKKYQRNNPQSWKKSLYMKNQKSQTAGEQWFYNVRMMHAISEQMGAKYYVFLQPTMGLSGVQTPPPTNSNDYKLYLELDEVYLETINSHYASLRSYCKLLPYCFDISSEAPASGDLYNDPRHHNAKGNQVIADVIYKKLFFLKDSMGVN